MKRKYVFQDADCRKNIDLTRYEQLVKKSVQKVNPEISVQVERDGYVLNGDFSNGQVRMIGRELRNTLLKQYSVQRMFLFKGMDIE